MDTEQGKAARVGTKSTTVDIGELPSLEGALSIAVDVVWPDLERLASPPRVFFCQPGGALGKGYYDLVTSDGDTAFSFARQMAAHGYITVAIDHLGIGGSSRPQDGFKLTPDILIEANARAVERIAAQLREGHFDPALPALPALQAIGVGHSMGGMLTILQQAQHRSYAALVVLGFGTRGMADYLPEAARAFSGDAAGARANIEALARAQGGEAYRELVLEGGNNAREVYGGGAERPAVMALVAARERLLSVAGLFAMIPGSAAPDCAAIDTPVFIGVGDRDISGPPHAIAAAFTGSSDVSLLVLPKTGHSHFLFTSSAQLYTRIARWAAAVTDAG